MGLMLGDGSKGHIIVCAPWLLSLLGQRSFGKANGVRARTVSRERSV